MGAQRVSAKPGLCWDGGLGPPPTLLTSGVPAALLQSASLSAEVLVLTACASSCSTPLCALAASRILQ